MSGDFCCARFLTLAFGVLALARPPCFAQFPAGRPLIDSAANPLFFEGPPQREGREPFVAVTPEARAYFLPGRVVFRIHHVGFELRFLNCAREIEPEGEDPQPTRVNYLIGNRPELWWTDRPTFRTLVYKQIYPGIDVRFRFSGLRVKSEFVIAPGADARLIRLRYSGLGSPHLDRQGSLRFASERGEFREEFPSAFQWKQGGALPTPAAFTIHPDGSVGLEVGAFDRTLPLTIDPVVSYSTYVGEHGDSAATSLAAAPNGEVYVAGWTDSLDLPVQNALQQATGGGVDVFVFKLNAAGNAVVYATYIGGSGDDRAYGIALDGSGEAYLAGSTTSPNFPALSAVQGGIRGARDAFVLKLNSAGNGLVFSTYLGGTGADSGNGIAVDTQGNAYVAGDTTSLDFPTLSPFQPNNNGRQNGFVTKLSSSGTLLYSTYLGGAGDDRATAVAVDQAGSAYVTGGTLSTNFPVVNALQTVNHGGQDVFVAKLGASGTNLLYSTYLGGSGGGVGAPECGFGIAVDSEGHAFVTGSTASADFPTAGAFQALAGGGTTNAFVSKLNASGTALLYSTYVGGSTMDYGQSIAVDSAGNANVAGYTASPDFPLVTPLQSRLAGVYDAFILQLSPSGGALNFATYYGGSGLDAANGIALDGWGNVYVAGQTLSLDFPVSGGIQATMRGSMEAFVLKLNWNGSQPDFSMSVVPATSNVPAGGSASYTVSVTGTNGFASAVNFSVSGLPAGASATFNPPSLTGSGTTLLSIDTTPGVVVGAATFVVTGVSGALTHNTMASLNVTANSGPPAAVSVTPSSGSGAVQSFAFAFSDPGGAANIVSAMMDINASLAAGSACYFYFVQKTHAIYLADDVGIFHTSLLVGSPGIAQNSQCALDSGSSSVAMSGNTLTLYLALTFKPAFTGAKGIFMEVYDGVLESGWVQRGAWSISQPDFSLSISPDSRTVAAGGAASYTVTVSAVNGFNGTVTFSLSGQPTGASTSFNPQTLVGAGSTTLAINTAVSTAPGSFGFTVTGTSGASSHNVTAGLIVGANAAPVAVGVAPNSGSGPSQTFAFSFSDANGGGNIVSTQIVINAALAVASSCYLYYSRAQNAIYLANDAGAFLPAISLGAAGTMQNSQCAIDASASWASIAGVTLTLNLAMNFKPAFAGAKNIYMEAYNGLDSGWAQRGAWTVTAAAQPDFSIGMSPPSQSISAGSSTSYSVTVASLAGFSGTVTFSVSGLPSGASGGFNPPSVTGSGTSTLTVTTTAGTSAGTSTVTATGTSASLVHAATASLTISAAGGPPSAVSVTPNSGSGSTQTFAFAFSNPGGAAGLISVQIDIAATLSAAHACYLYYSVGSNVIYLADDAGAYHAGLTVGSPGTSQNSQCTVNAGSSSVGMSGNLLTLNLVLSFKPAFAGAKNVYMEAYNGQDSGWAQRGTWTAQ